MPVSRHALLARLSCLPEHLAEAAETGLLVHASVCLAPRTAGPARITGSWAPYLQPSTLPSGWDVHPLLADTDHVNPGECAEVAVIGVPEEPVPLAWVARGEMFRLLEQPGPALPGSVEVGKGVVLRVHWPR